MKKLTADDPNTRSTDILANSVEKSNMLFPEVSTEGKIESEVFLQFLSGGEHAWKKMLQHLWYGKWMCLPDPHQRVEILPK